MNGLAECATICEGIFGNVVELGHLVAEEGADALLKRLGARHKLHNAQAAADGHHIVSAHLHVNVSIRDSST